MTWLDVVIVGFTILMAVWGYSLGARTAAVLVLGFVGGAFLGAIVGPLVLDAGSRPRLDTDEVNPNLPSTPAGTRSLLALT